MNGKKTNSFCIQDDYISLNIRYNYCDGCSEINFVNINQVIRAIIYDNQDKVDIKEKKIVSDLVVF